MNDRATIPTFTFVNIIRHCRTAVILGFFLAGCIDGPTKPEPLSQDLLAIRLTEIHYHPLDLDDIINDSLEFIEVKNTSATPLNIGTLKFTGGIDYSFPSGTVVPPNGFFVIASNAKAFRQRYGFVPDGIFTGQLKNSGETIEIADTRSIETVVSQTYSDTGSWPGSADGDGYSLVPVKINPARNDTDSDCWRASTKIHGSPGADDELKAFDSSLLALRITEINYNPEAPDSAASDSLEFIELKNTGTVILDLTDVAVTKGVDYRFVAGTTLNPGAFIVIAASAAWFEERYGFKPFDSYEGQLRNSSETITIEDRKAAVTLLTITYTDDKPWPAQADGEGRSLVPMQVNPAREEQIDPAAWRASFRLHGSPGYDDPGVVLVNEVLSHTDTPHVDAIELYNPNEMDINLGGWYLSDEIENPVKFRIPDGITIKAGGYHVFTANDFNKDTTFSSFGLSERGDDACLSSDSTGCRGYCHGCSFGALERNVSYGRYIVPSTGNEVFVPMRDITLGKANSGPLISSLVISEIMCRAEGGTSDFIELTNIGLQEITLYDKEHPDNTWRLQIEDQWFSFPKGASVKSRESVVIICGKMSVDAFRTGNSLAPEVQLFSFSDSIPDMAAKIELEKPMPPDKDSAGVVLPDIEYMECDKISFKNQTPWPIGTLGTGSSLTRIDNNGFGNDPANWRAAVPTPGKVD